MNLNDDEFARWATVLGAAIAILGVLIGTMGILWASGLGARWRWWGF